MRPSPFDNYPIIGQCACVGEWVGGWVLGVGEGGRVRELETGDVRVPNSFEICQQLPPEFHAASRFLPLVILWY